jgi:DNA-binding response OmpR family regulator
MGATNKKKVLIVDDEAAYLKLLGSVLIKEGYEVIEACDGENGLSLARKHRPDIILLDIRLPKMDGLSLLRNLREDQYGKTAKVVLLTNIEPDDSIIRRVLKDKPALYLMKSDIPIPKLVEELRSFILQEEYAD